MIDEIRNGLKQVGENTFKGQYSSTELVGEVEDAERAMQLLSDMNEYNKEFTAGGGRVCFSIDYIGAFDPDDLRNFIQTQPLRMKLKTSTLIEMRQIAQVDSSSFLMSSKGEFRTIEGMLKKIKSHLSTSSLFFINYTNSNVIKLLIALLIVAGDLSIENETVEFVPTGNGILLNYSGGNPNYS